MSEPQNQAQNFDEYWISRLKEDTVKLENIPKEFLSHRIYLEALKIRGWSLGVIAAKNVTLEMCETAIDQNGYSLVFVPERFISTKIYYRAVNQNGLALFLVPPSKRDTRICQTAYNNNPEAWRHIPMSVRRLIKK